MDHKERFFTTVARERVDRPASWLGLPVDSALPALLKYFGVPDVDALKRKLNDDIYPVQVPYNNPPANDVGSALNFAKTGASGKQDERTLTAPGFFEDMSDPELVHSYDWPDPEKHLDIEASKKLVKSIPADYAKMGIMWSAHFQDANAAFGMENALVTLMMYPEMFLAVIDRITEFYLKLNEMFYEATKGFLDAVLIGNDFGSQVGLMVDPGTIRQYVFPGTQKLIDQAKSYGLTVMHHSCGSIHPIIGDLFDMGVDVIHPIQALAANMDAARMKEDFGDKGAFCGGIDAQELLVNGKPGEIREKVAELKAIFPTGLILSPSHEAILPDIEPANVEAIFIP